jgi:chaperonin GroES
MQLLGKSVLILPDQLPERTDKGVLIPTTAKDKPQTGTIVDCGPVCTYAKKGLRIIFPRKSASVIVIDDKDYYFLNEDRITYIAGEDEQLS